MKRAEERVPRHNDINEILADVIIKNLSNN
jgi:hypothetical protein